MKNFANTCYIQFKRFYTLLIYSVLQRVFALL